jgi:hypothetical protein
MKIEYIFKNIAYIILSVLLLFNTLNISAQNSRGFNYQAIARDKSGQPIVNKDIVIEVSILAGSAMGPIVWQEGHEIITNQFGLFNIIIGQGITTGLGSLSKFSDIPWSSGDYYVRIRIDFGNGLVKLGVTKLQAVPYAMVADSVLHPVEYSAGTGITLSSNTFSHAMHTGDATGITNLSVVGLQGRTLSATPPVLNDVIKWNGLSWAPSVDDNTIYNSGTGISIAGTTISHIPHTGDATGNTALTVTGIQGRGISPTAPNAGEILKWNGTSWIPDIDNNTTYSAGSGVILNGTTFSHDNHTGDVTGISSLTVTGIQGRNISANAPVSGEVLKWTGVNWSPSTDLVNEYAAGTGLSLNLNTFFVLPHTHTGDVFGQTSLTVQGIQGRAVSGNVPLDGEVLKWSNLNSQWEPAAENTVNYIAGTGITINTNTINANNSLAIWNASKLAGNNISSNLPSNGQVLKWNNVLSQWEPDVDNVNTYSGGTGISLAGNSFSHDLHSGDVTGITSLLVTGIRGRNVSTNIPAIGEVLNWNGTEWIPATAGSSYSAGSGLTLTGNTFSISAPVSVANGGTGQMNFTDGELLIGTSAGNTLAKSTLTAGTGITIINAPGSITITNNDPNAMHSGDASGMTTLTVTGLQGRPLSSTAPNNLEVLGWNGIEWRPVTDATNTYDAGTGITLAANSFSHTAHTGDATGVTSLKVVALQGRSVSTIAPNNLEVLGWNGTEWGPITDANTFYDAGTGLALNSNTFINTGDLSSTNELQNLAFNPLTRALSISSGTGVTLPIFTILTAGLVPPNGLVGTTTRYLRADGTWQVPYSAGTGLTLTGTSVFNHAAHTGDATGSTSLTVTGIRGRNILATVPTAGNVLGWNGANWGPVPDQNNTYTSGAGITLTGSTFSHTAHTGDATGTTSLTVVALQGSAVSAVAPNNNQILKWNGAAWTPVNETLYEAGNGLSLNTGTFTNTGDLSSVNELQNLAYTVSTGVLDISSGTGVTLPAFSTTSTDPGLTPGSNNGGSTVYLDGTGSWSTPVGTTYAAGSGITLAANTFTHTPHSGDATGATSLTVTGIRGRNILTTIPTAGNVLGWNGANWGPVTDQNTQYSAGTGLSLNAGTFSNTGDLSSLNELQTLNYTAATRNLSISSTNTITLPFFNLINPGLVPGSGGGFTNFLRADGSWAVPAGTIYTAGTGITIAGTTFSHSAHTGDATGSTSLIVVAIQGKSVSTTAPSNNQLLKWNGAAWTPADETSYAAGTGITLAANTFSHTAHTGDATGSTSLTVVAIQGNAVSATAPTNNQILKWNGTDWTPVDEVAYTAGTGITLTANTFSHTAHTGDATGTTSLTVVAIQGNAVSATAPTNNQILKWNGTDWTPVDEVAYTAGTGITLTANTFSHTAHTGDATGTTSLTVVALQGRTVSTNAPANNEVLGWNGATWIPMAATSTPYAAGTGITLAGSSFSHTAHTGDATGSTSLTVVAIRGRSLSATIPTAGNYLGWNGATWIPSIPAGTTYAAGTGITLAANTFSHTAHTGDATGTTSLTVVALQGRSVSTSAPANNEFLGWNGATWIPMAATSNPYAAGTGITLAGSSFSHTAHTGDATGTTSLTVVAIQGKAISTTGPAANQVLEWNGAAWTPATDDNTLYAAGTGLSLNAGTFSNTGDLSSVNELQNLTYSAASHDLAISSANTVNLPLFSTTSAVAGLVPGSTTGNATIFLNGAGSWSVPAGTSYGAGTGITLAAGSFSHTAHTGDATGATSLTVVALQGRSVSATIPTAGNYLGWNGATWTPSIPAGTTYAAGTGITLTANTFSHTAHTGDATGTTSLTVVALQGRSVNTTVPTAGNFLGWNGASWIPTVATGTTYAAGTGITLAANTFTHTAHTGDATGSTSLTVVALRGRSVATTIPTAGNYLGWNGANWIPSVPTGTTYAAGTGITLAANTFTHAAHTGDATGSTSLTVVALRGRSVATTIPTAGNYLGWNGANWIPSVPTGTTYAAGTGITLAANTFSHTAHTGDATGTTSLTVVALQGRSVTTTIPTAGNYLGWNGANWVPSVPTGTTYAAGTGITLAANTFSHTAHTGDATGSTSLTVVALQGRSLATTIPTAGNYLGWNGANWVPSVPTATGYAAGTGITLAANTFSHTAHTGDATGTTSLIVVALRGRSVSTNVPVVNQVLEWNGASWAPAADDNTIYAAGTGILLNTGTFSNTGDLSSVNELQSLTYTAASRDISISSGNTVNLPLFSTASAVAGLVPGSVTGNATQFLNGAGSWSTPTGTTYAAGTGIALNTNTFINTGDLSSVNELQNLAFTPATGVLDISLGTGVTLPLFATASTDIGLVPGSNGGGVNVFLNGNGGWTAPTGTTYAAGTGITLGTNTFSHTPHTGDATGSTSLTVVALQGQAISTTVPTNNQLLRWTGTSWTPSTEISYAAGTGITLAANTFSHTAHTGDATGSTSLTVVALRGRSLSATIPTAGNYLGWNGATWIASNPVGTTYAAGTGITLTGTTFSHPAHTADVTGSTSLTVVAIQGSAVSTTTPANNQLLRWNGASWTPSDETSYAAGTGISLTGNTFSNTGDLSSVNELQTLTYTAASRDISISSGNSITLPLFSTGSAVGGMVPGSVTGSATIFLNGAGAWSVPVGTTYAAGTGITLTANTFSHTAHTGDATGTTSLTVVAIQGDPVSAAAPTNNQLLRWTGAAWTPSAETSYTSGLGITLTGTTFSHTAHTGDATGTTSLTVVALQGIPVSSSAPANTQLLRYNGTNWIPSAETAYTAGLGITISGTTFSHTAHTGDATGTTSLTVVALRGVSLSTSAPVNNQILRYSGGNWTPSAETAYTAGLGITISGTTFSHTAHTGDATGTTSLTVVALRGRSIANTVPTVGMVLTWNGTDWTPTNAGAYAAGTGMTLTSSTFSHTAHTGDATGSTSLTVVALQGKNVATITPTDRNLLTWVNASSRWEPVLFTSFADANNDTKITVEANPNEDKIRFNTNGSERMIIDNTGKVGIGISGPTSNLSLNGSLALTTFTHSTSPANLTLDDSHSFVIITASTGNVNLPLASSCPGRMYIIKHTFNGLGSVTITPNGTDNIDGTNAAVSLGILQAYILISDGASNWSIIVK